MSRTLKPLFLGVYRQPTGYGQAARDYILALDAAGVDVVPRPVFLGQERCGIPERIVELEKKSASGATHVIQHLLPHLYEYAGGVKNIGLFAWETSHFRGSTWAEKLNTLDEAWVINRKQFYASVQSGVNVPIRVVPHATDIRRFERNYPPLEELQAKLAGAFTFYTIGELVRRKNLAGLLKAFHLEFDPNEPVALVIKASIPGKSPMEVASYLEGMTTDIKQGLKLYRDVAHYHREHVVTDRLSPEGMMRLHATCDCFVQPSYGEAWSIPAFDAMAMGRTPIVSGNSGFLDWMSPETGWLIECRPEPVFAVMDSFADLYTGAEEWQMPSIDHLRRAMREAFENRELRRQKAEAGIDRAYAFTYENVGNYMRQLLDQ